MAPKFGTGWNSKRAVDDLTPDLVDGEMKELQLSISVDATAMNATIIVI
jgi:hypothetical protein